MFAPKKAEGLGCPPSHTEKCINQIWSEIKGKNRCWPHGKSQSFTATTLVPRAVEYEAAFWWRRNLNIKRLNLWRLLRNIQTWIVHLKLEDSDDLPSSKKNAWKKQIKFPKVQMQQRRYQGQWNMRRALTWRNSRGISTSKGLFCGISEWMSAENMTVTKQIQSRYYCFLNTQTKNAADKMNALAMETYVWIQKASTTPNRLTWTCISILHHHLLCA